MTGEPASGAALDRGAISAIQLLDARTVGGSRRSAITALKLATACASRDRAASMALASAALRRFAATMAAAGRRAARNAKRA